MNRVDSHNSVAERPAAEASEVQTPGYFSIGDMEAGVNGTVVPAWWLNSVQEEILNVIENAGIVPSKVQSNQLMSAIVNMIQTNNSVVQIIQNINDINSSLSSIHTIANSGVIAAAEAQTTANNGLIAAADADDKASEALNTAQNGFMLASEKFITLDDAVNASDYLELTRLYLTNGDSTNFPDDLDYPIFFKVNNTEDGGAAIQNVCDSSGSRVYNRIGNINSSDIENIIVNWTPWNSIAVPEIVKNVAIVTDPDGQEPGKYLVVTFETESGDQLAYIDLSDLISVYISGNNGISVFNNQIGLKIDSANANGLSIGEAGLQLAAVNSLTIVRNSIDTAAGIAENEVLTVDPYIVGQNRFQLFMLGLLCSPGEDRQYLEIGTANQSSTKIKILFPIAAGSRLEYIIYS
jgi:hypothetical protein